VNCGHLVLPPVKYADATRPLTQLELQLGDHGSMPSGTAKSSKPDRPGHEHHGTAGQRQFLHGKPAQPVEQRPDPGSGTRPGDRRTIRALRPLSSIPSGHLPACPTCSPEGDTRGTGPDQSLLSFEQGIMIRTRREPKSTIRAVSSFTLTTRPRPYLSCVTWSCSANSSAGGAGAGAANGLVGKRRRVAARACFIITSMRHERLASCFPATGTTIRSEIDDRSGCGRPDPGSAACG
jgi:hypothetical protein